MMLTLCGDLRIASFLTGVRVLGGKFDIGPECQKGAMVATWIPI